MLGKDPARLILNLGDAVMIFTEGVGEKKAR